MSNATTNPSGRPRQSAAKLGVKQTARLAARRAIKDNVKKSTSNPLLYGVLVAALGAAASYFINKQ